MFGFGSKYNKELNGHKYYEDENGRKHFEDGMDYISEETRLFYSSDRFDGIHDCTGRSFGTNNIDRWLEIKAPNTYRDIKSTPSRLDRMEKKIDLLLDKVDALEKENAKLRDMSRAR